MCDGLVPVEESWIESILRIAWWKLLRRLGFEQVGPLGVGPWRYVGRKGKK